MSLTPEERERLDRLGLPQPTDPRLMGPQCVVCLERAVDPVQIGGIAAATGPGYAAWACRMCAAEEGLQAVSF